MSEKTKKIMFIVNIIVLLLMVATLIFQFVPYWSFKVVKTKAVSYDEQNKIIHVLPYVDEGNLSIVSYVWLPTDATKSEIITEASLNTVYAIGSYDGWRVKIDDSFYDLVEGRDYFKDADSYFSKALGIEVDINYIVAYYVIQIVLLIAGIIFAILHLKKTPFAGVLGFIAAVVGLMGNFISPVYVLSNLWLVQTIAMGLLLVAGVYCVYQTVLIIIAAIKKMREDAKIVYDESAKN